MKKVLFSTLFFFVLLGKTIACEIPTEQNYIHLSLAISYNDNLVVDSLKKKYCFSYFKNPFFGDSPLMQINDFNQYKSIIKDIDNDELNRGIASGFGENLLISRMLLRTLPEKIKIEMEKEINSVKLKYNYILPLPLLKKEDNDKIIINLALVYHDSYFNFIDVFGNTPLFYAILTNRPDIINISTSKSEGKSALYRINKDDITPLHLLFSPEIKAYDMQKVNDNILKQIDINKLLNIEYRGIDYFQFITIMKHNNLDLFNKLYKKYKFDVTITPSISKTVNNMNLDYIKRLNLIYEKNR